MESIRICVGCGFKMAACTWVVFIQFESDVHCRWLFVRTYVCTVGPLSAGTELSAFLVLFTLLVLFVLCMSFS